MKAMIFAAGLGTRLRPLTDTKPKALVEIKGKTLLEYQIMKLKAAGIEDIVVNVHHFPDLIIDFLRTHDNFGCKISVSDEREELLDTGGGLLRAYDMLFPEGEQSEVALACNVDIISNIDIKRLMDAHERESLATLVVSERETQRYLLFDEQQSLRGWTNIKTGEIRPAALDAIRAKVLQRLAFSGMQVLSPKILNSLKAVKKEKGAKFSVIDLYLHAISEGIIKAFIPTDYRMTDVGKIEEIAILNNEVN